MRVIGVALALVVACLAASAARPEATSACMGRILEFKDAIGMSDGAIYAGRITRADYATFTIDVTIDVEHVVRGPGAARVRRAQAGDVCDGIQVGEWGYMVRGVNDPQYGSETDDLFFRVGRFAARNALIAAGMPETSTVSAAAIEASPNPPWSWLAFWSVAAFVLALRSLRGRRCEDPIP